ncbi:MAG: hypothetical protein HY259_12125 [Chloroflexi bacterium]|nr:hypothetical protein [Chloroflexota bacterium]
MKKIASFTVKSLLLIALALMFVVALDNGSESASAQGPDGATVGRSEKHDVSAALRTIAPVRVQAQKFERENPMAPVRLQKEGADEALQTAAPSGAMPAPIANFAGVNTAGSGCTCYPPDTNLDVSATQVFQTVNLAFEIWDKAGNVLYGPAHNNTIWSGFGGTCETQNNGDPVVKYDRMANRWVFMQFGQLSAPYNLCLAVSQTSDALGAWYRYSFVVSSNQLPDYPKLAVWPDGYYVSINAFTNGATWAGPKPYVFDRASMLNGAAATFQTFTSLGSTHAPQLPSDLDGVTPPPAGAPNYFVEFGNPQKWYAFHVDWANSANSTFTNYASTSVATFRIICANTRSCIAQPGTTVKLDAIGDRLMYRLSYRNFGTYESLVANHTVQVSRGVAGVRWYEFRNPSAPTVFQQATYSPDDNARWMGSIAQDKQGNMALGYSVSSKTNNVFPSIRYAGRLATDPLNQLSQAETTLIAGTGSQTGSADRWGDYSAMQVDPTDDCTFWYTTEYYITTASVNWQTRIGSFKFPGCN